MWPSMQSFLQVEQQRIHSCRIYNLRILYGETLNYDL